MEHEDYLEIKKIPWYTYLNQQKVWEVKHIKIFWKIKKQRNCQSKKKKKKENVRLIQKV